MANASVYAADDNNKLMVDEEGTLLSISNTFLFIHSFGWFDAEKAAISSCVFAI